MTCQCPYPLTSNQAALDCQGCGEPIRDWSEKRGFIKTETMKLSKAKKLYPKVRFN